MSHQDLSKLTRAQKLTLLDAVEEKRRRQLEARPTYTPNKGQIEVHSSEAVLRLVAAANGSGKSALAVQEALWAAEGYNPIRKKHTPVPAKVVVVLDSPAKVEEVWLPEVRKWRNIPEPSLHKRGKPYYTQITFPNGSDITFMFNEQEELAFESIQIDFCVADEPMKRSNYIGLRRGGRKKGRQARYLLIATPITGAWMRRDIWEPWTKGQLPDTECFRFSTEVNKQNLADGYIETFSRVLSEKEKRIRLHGEFFDLEGLALAHLFNRDTHVLPDNYYFNPSWPTVLAIDPHPRKAHVALLLGVSPDNYLFALKEFSSKSVPSQFARELRNWCQGYKLVDSVCDSLGSTPMSGGIGNRSFIEVLNDNGMRTRATTFADKSDEQWIAKIQEVLAIPPEPDSFGKQIPRLRIHKSCKGLIGDIESVEWAKFRHIDEYKPKLAIESKDFLATLKYALAAEPRYTKGREQVIRPKNPISWNNKEKWRNRS